MLKRRGVALLISVMIVVFVLLNRYTDSPVPYPAIMIPGIQSSGTERAETPGPAVPQEITVSVPLRLEETTRLREFIAQYEVNHPDIRVRVIQQPVPAEYDSSLTVLRMGEAPDIMLVDNVWVSEWAAQGYLQPLDSYYTPEHQVKHADDMVSQLKWNGYIWGIPKDMDPYIIVYHKQTFADDPGGVPPNFGEPLLSVHKELSNAEKGTFGLWADPDDPYAVISLLWALGGSVERALNGQDGGALSSSKEESIKLLEAYLSVPHPAEPLTVEEAWSYLQNGTIAMMIAPSSIVKLLPKDGLESIEIGGQAGAANDSIPKGTARTVQRSGGWMKGRSFVITAGSDHASESAKFLLELSGREVQSRLVEAGTGQPAALPEFDWLTGRSAHVSKARVLPADPQQPMRMRRLAERTKELWAGNITARQYMEPEKEQKAGKLEMASDR
ncbi:extracellular solute-binding protein [Paenibacillus turpanensis]|uniref:extracellular solute-binding protein n=1 Tax=Paenibacillus turpanensis TaxID=2689078 RepID=UPI00140AFB15|nr:extracellular solute-binding protein [Paenibacillus turpanensis]